MQGLPYQGSQTTSMYGQQPTGGQSLLAGGVAGMGAYNAFMNQQGRGQQQQQQQQQNNRGSGFAGPGVGYGNIPGAQPPDPTTPTPTSGTGYQPSVPNTPNINVGPVVDPGAGVQKPAWMTANQNTANQQGNAAAGGGW